MDSILHIIGRSEGLFSIDIDVYQARLVEIVNSSSFLVLGGAGSIGQSVTKEIFKRNPKKLHIVDISENNIAELVRDIRSSLGYIDGDFETFTLDIGSVEYDAFFNAHGQYDYIFNLSALKHVRSEKDPYTLMRMIDVNIFNTDKTLKQAVKTGVKKYFCVSTDKAANPVNMMGASKRIMEMFLMRNSQDIEISTARFANVAFSDGSLLHSFNQRLEKNQPIVGPNDVRRYFITPQEAAELCIMSCLFGNNGDIFFPKPNVALRLTTFTDIVTRFLFSKGYEPFFCDGEDEARELAKTLPKKGKWPCLFTKSDTTGEKDFEEFFTDQETLDLNRFNNFGIIKSNLEFDGLKLRYFEDQIFNMKQKCTWDKEGLIKLFNYMLPDFDHNETGKHLESKM